MSVSTVSVTTRAVLPASADAGVTFTIWLLGCPLAVAARQDTTSGIQFEFDRPLCTLLSVYCCMTVLPSDPRINAIRPDLLEPRLRIYRRTPADGVENAGDRFYSNEFAIFL